MSDEPVIHLQGVQKRYRRGDMRISIFEGLDLAIPRGDFVAVMGPSGSGKSTLLNLLGGVDRSDAGAMTVAGARIDRYGETQLTRWRAEHVGFVFQFYNLLPILTAAQNVELPLLCRRVEGRAARVAAALKVVNLSDRADHYPGQLSGGQQQRVAIARAIVADPDLLLCDEPTGDLDRSAANDVLEMLSLLNRDFGKTIVMVTHDPAAAAFARRTLSLDKGQFVGLAA